MGKRRRKRKKEVAPFLWLYFPLFLLHLPSYRTEEGLPFLHRGALVFAKEKKKKTFAAVVFFFWGNS